ncbi:hypothetical protein ACFSCX_18405 [Bacillus salitolerans]|uniref:Uncharacterized protein n=1 Tax=Bacillus salitolerans TaxID=1437434 RepID=A0ABW4LTR2_9BACI
MTGNKEIPDFDSLSDRIIAEPTSEPTFVIKTNLDPKSNKEENPYYHHDDFSVTAEEKFNQYFRKS